MTRSCTVRITVSINIEIPCINWIIPRKQYSVCRIDVKYSEALVRTYRNIQRYISITVYSIHQLYICIAVLTMYTPQCEDSGRTKRISLCMVEHSWVRSKLP